jgi:hypothetical protein
VDHPGRRPKGVTYLFGGFVRVVSDLRHPRPRLHLSPGGHGGNSTGARIRGSPRSQEWNPPPGSPHGASIS